jgi:hypothetical protein
MDAINNLVDFGEVFNKIREEERQKIVDMILTECYAERHDDDVVCDNCQDIVFLITGENEETMQ